jgi:methyl-accepting chemotaxis protein
MDSIEESSRKIRSIISVIDDIAFQTNLLALNAGVEAARAGDAGKGFAVVAQEVRELAQRSASAAKEIGGLITSSSSEVESGVVLVKRTGDALTRIQEDIDEIHSHVQAIVEAAREQRGGIEEISSSVTELDRTTQQNAAMAEETAASISELARGADELNRRIASFVTSKTEVLSPGRAAA